MGLLRRSMNKRERKIAAFRTLADVFRRHDGDLPTMRQAIRVLGMVQRRELRRGKKVSEQLRIFNKAKELF